ncbi:FtsH protease activity modulator HflK [Treponema phagedenis]|uniref:Protein HflK n=2 Tax=Treponema phagedenis TaxID=162 RepID=A0AAE6ITY0_TREPH|nr:FtsH protease activity modulator HflK [Treponema phagedenis]QEK01973.1 FtsH protease activity modulator HflK [Treponema phagedenis]QEK02628.1 FtsH protease activity modulator HflK [Treponema phagedenis]QEK07085.1 FtsH protease activity modulator HflK [Treponema phagedenis]QEK08254.1 FtsH protease activity modulator HflK [Treponema phagedenis]
MSDSLYKKKAPAECGCGYKGFITQNSLFTLFNKTWYRTCIGQGDANAGFACPIKPAIFFTGESMKKKTRPLAVIIVVAAAFLIYKAFVIIPTTDSGVVTRLGKYNRTLQPGLYFVIPYIDYVYKVPVTTVQKEEFGFRTVQSANRSQYQNDIIHESLMLTGDLNIVLVEWVVQYRIVDPKAWLFKVESVERNKTIRDISKSVVNSLIGDRAILDIMGPARANIQELAKDMLNEQYKRIGLGISVTSMQLQNVIPPEEVQQAFQDVNIAIQDMNRLINEGKEAYNKEIPKARGDADKLIQEAMGYASERVNKASGDVARFNAVYAEYVKAPDVTRRRLYLETLDSIFENTDNVLVIDKNIKNFLPLKDLQKGKN